MWGDKHSNTDVVIVMYQGGRDPAILPPPASSLPTSHPPAAVALVDEVEFKVREITS